MFQMVPSLGICGKIFVWFAVFLSCSDFCTVQLPSFSCWCDDCLSPDAMGTVCPVDLLAIWIHSCRNSDDIDVWCEWRDTRCNASNCWLLSI